ncbi:MAG: hypothetical protein MRZ79_14715 [Bacteroidia bacterium]|nr:hypothetical protein [Bacteroidia bacterium]
MKNYLITIVGVTLFLFGFQACVNSSKTAKKPAEVNRATVFKAVEMPSTLANGDAFPTDSTIIDEWVGKRTVENGVETNPDVIGHAWGLWKALTDYTDQTFDGRKLRRYETWYTPQDVMRAAQQNVGLEGLSRTDGPLQFRKKFKFGHEKELDPVAGDISGKVKYNPAMAKQTLAGDYFNQSVLENKIEDGKINSLSFLPNAVMLKPIYRVLTDKNKVEGTDNTYYFNIWSGKQDGGKDIKDFAKKIKVTTDLNNPAIDNETTYGIDQFIYHNMSAAEAYTYNHSSKEGQEFDDTAKVGDPVILLGSHVSTRESRRWTWQTFYWTPNPDNPVFPSSNKVAEIRNGISFTAPAKHYAASIAYSMMSPALPFTGPPVDIKKADVEPVYGLNPYIEGTFTPDVFPDQDKFYSGAYKKQFYEGNITGITSNCMSCHSQAYFKKGLSIPVAVKNFLSDQYVNRNAPWFESSIQLDFAWSLFPGFEPKPSQVTKP